MNICEICDDEGADWTAFDSTGDVGPVYHLGCVVKRAENPDNLREGRGMGNLLRYGRKIVAFPFGSACLCPDGDGVEHLPGCHVPEMEAARS